MTVVFKLPRDQLYVTYFGGNESAGLKPDLECRQLWLDLGYDNPVTKAFRASQCITP